MRVPFVVYDLAPGSSRLWETRWAGMADDASEAVAMYCAEQVGSFDWPVCPKVKNLKTGVEQMFPGAAAQHQAAENKRRCWFGPNKETCVVCGRVL